MSRTGYVNFNASGFTTDDGVFYVGVDSDGSGLGILVTLVAYYGK